MHPEDQGRLQPLWPRFEGAEIGPPVTLDLELTDVCTHRCPWCIYPRRPTYLPVEAARVAFADAVTLGTDSIIVAGGGEPLLHPQAEAILALGAEHDVGVTLFTNGEALGQHADVIGASCDYVRLSLDAGTAHTHARLHGTDEALFDQIFDRRRRPGGPDPDRRLGGRHQPERRRDRAPGPAARGRGRRSAAAEVRRPALDRVEREARAPPGAAAGDRARGARRDRPRGPDAGVRRGPARRWPRPRARSSRTAACTPAAITATATSRSPTSPPRASPPCGAASATARSSSATGPTCTRAA